MLGRCGFNANVQTVFSDANFEAMDEASLKNLGDKDIDSMTKSLNGKELTVPNVAGGPDINVRLYFPRLAVERLKTACFIARHFQKTQRTFTSAWVTIARLDRWRAQKEVVSQREDPDMDTLELTSSKMEDVLTWLEDFPEKLSRFTGLGDRPLSYVIRGDAAVPAEAGDPTFGEANSKYTDVRMELEARSERSGADYQSDNSKVFELLTTAVKEHPTVLEWLKPHKRTKNGASAWEGLKAHYRGTAQLDGIANRAESDIENSRYDGERYNYTFEIHCTRHQTAHRRIEEASGTALSERDKVRRFLNTIYASSMAAAIDTVKANTNLNTDFNACVNHLRQSVVDSRSKRKVNDISTVYRPSSNKSPSKETLMAMTPEQIQQLTIELRYYPNNVMKHLTDTQRSKLKKLREEAKAKRDAKKKKKDVGKDKTLQEKKQARKEKNKARKARKAAKVKAVQEELEEARRQLASANLNNEPRVRFEQSVSTDNGGAARSGAALSRT